jgi:heterodisulfide reductase subunit C
MDYNAKAVTFDVLKEMAEYLFRHQNQKKYNEIQTKVADFLVTNGEKKFLEVYNEIQKTKDYIKALDTFKI